MVALSASPNKMEGPVSMKMRETGDHGDGWTLVIRPCLVLVLLGLATEDAVGASHGGGALCIGNRE